MALPLRNYNPEEIPASVTLEQATNNLLVMMLTQFATKTLPHCYDVEAESCSYACTNTIFAEEVLHRAEEWIEKHLIELLNDLHASGLVNR